MKIHLSDHFTYRKLYRFVFPSIIMMIFTSIYSIVDGLFVSNFVGKTPFAALNLMMPAIMMVSCFGFMLGTGGSAVIAKTLGEGKQDKANGYFSLLILTIFMIGVLVLIIGTIGMPLIASLLKATKEMRPYAILYGRILMVSCPFFMLQTAFQALFVTAEKPKLGLFVTILAGCANIVLDFILVGYLRLGIAGAAVATACSEITGGLIPIVYFMKKNTSLLQLTRPIFDYKVLLKSASNGASEFMSNISGSIVGMIYNYQLLKYAGENGVAAYGAIMYVNFIFIAIYLGFSTGSAPIVGYHLGAQNHAEMKNIFKKSILSILAFEVLIFTLSFVSGKGIMQIFVGYDIELMNLTVYGFRIYSIHYLLCGLNIYASSFFTALNNGVISAIISFMRSLVFQLGALFIMPIYFEASGIWWAIVIAEIGATLLTVYYLNKYKKVYHYI